MGKEPFDQDIWKEYEIFNRIYPYALKIQKVSAGTLKSLLKSQNKQQEAIRLLEIWTWNWETTEQILKQIPNASIDTVDISQTMIDQAIKRLWSEHWKDKITFILEDIASYLPRQESDIYDGVISVYTLHNIKDQTRIKIYNEIWRVLKNDWFFVNWDKCARNNILAHQNDLKEWLQKLEIFTQMRRNDLYQSRADHYEKDDNVLYKMTEDMQRKYLEAAWFKDIKYKGRFLTDVIISAINKKI